MTEVARALYQFFSGFELEAYIENAVPKEARLPYITYQVSVPDWRDSATIYARIWYRSESLEGVFAKADEIGEAIGAGVSVDTADGAVWLFKGRPFAQYMPMPGDDTLRVLYLNIEVHALTE